MATHSSDRAREVQWLYQRLQIPQVLSLRERTTFTLKSMSTHPDHVPFIYARFPAGAKEGVRVSWGLQPSEHLLKDLFIESNLQDYQEIMSGESLYFIAGHRVSVYYCLSTLYRRFKEIDGFLYVVLCRGRNFVPQPRFLRGLVRPVPSRGRTRATGEVPSAKAKENVARENENSKGASTKERLREGATTQEKKKFVLRFLRGLVRRGKAGGKEVPSATEGGTEKSTKSTSSMERVKQGATTTHVKVEKDRDNEKVKADVEEEKKVTSKKVKEKRKESHT
ncbi:hypothetical protein Pcinc_030735 [Petrolisthes cinctipes]|uniref:Uncharacterized protein n=1 Tax=Petrolisthes cinctipes TaxID=88211 RepID=A0AAE1EXI4_PETCI|nr:hypothetical protein Pcinc_030735 [Petrolisthes cinctipes]